RPAVISRRKRAGWGTGPAPLSGSGRSVTLADPLHPLDIRPEDQPRVPIELEVGPERNPMRPVDIERLAGQVMPGHFPGLAFGRVAPRRTVRPPDAAVLAPRAIVPQHEEPIGTALVVVEPQPPQPGEPRCVVQEVEELGRIPRMLVVPDHIIIVTA